MIRHRGLYIKLNTCQSFLFHTNWTPSFSKIWIYAFHVSIVRQKTCPRIPSELRPGGSCRFSCTICPWRHFKPHWKRMGHVHSCSNLWSQVLSMSVTWRSWWWTSSDYTVTAASSLWSSQAAVPWSTLHELDHIRRKIHYTQTYLLYIQALAQFSFLFSTLTARSRLPRFLNEESLRRNLGLPVSK